MPTNAHHSTASFNRDDIATETEQVDLDTDWPYQFLERLCSWQEVVQASEEFPGEVLETLLQCHEHVVAQQWADIFAVDPNLKQVRLL